MRSYNAAGYAVLAVYALVSALLAPPALGPGGGLAVGMLYLVFIWLVGGLYLSVLLHMGLAHKALDFAPWFSKSLTLVCCTTAVYIDPRAWVNRHRHHHGFSDRPGDPNKLSEDGFWKTLYLCLFPYPCRTNLARDAIFETWPFRLATSSAFAVAVQFTSYLLLWWLVSDWAYALALWCSVRLVALWVNMVQNYWTHDRRFGTRRYHDADDNAMNIGDWLPVTATLSACWQNNHHHYPNLVRCTHAPGEYDPGFQAVRLLHRLGVVKASASGLKLPPDIPLQEVGL